MFIHDNVTNIPHPGAVLGGGCRGCTGGPPPPPDDLQLSNTTGILQKKKTMRVIGVEVRQDRSAPPPKKYPGSAPDTPLPGSNNSVNQT